MSYLDGHWRQFRLSIEHVPDGVDVADARLLEGVANHLPVPGVQGDIHLKATPLLMDLGKRLDFLCLAT